MITVKAKLEYFRKVLKSTSDAVMYALLLETKRYLRHYRISKGPLSMYPLYGIHSGLSIPTIPKKDCHRN